MVENAHFFWGQKLLDGSCRRNQLLCCFYLDIFLAILHSNKFSSNISSFWNEFQVNNGFRLIKGSDPILDSWLLKVQFFGLGEWSDLYFTLCCLLDGEYWKHHVLSPITIEFQKVLFLEPFEWCPPSVLCELLILLSINECRTNQHRSSVC